MPDSSTPPRFLLGALFLGTLLAALDIAIVGPALPALAETFGLDERMRMWVFGVFVLANLAGLPVSTALSDRSGRRKVYLGAVLLFAIGTLVTVFSQSFEVLLIGRTIQGFGASGIFPIATAVVGDVFPTNKRGRAVGILGAVFGLAFLIGPIIGGIMLAFTSWRWLFSLLLPLAAVVFVTGMRTVPDIRSETPRSPDLLGTALLIGALVLIAFGLNRMDSTALWTSLLDFSIGLPVLFGILLAVAFVISQRHIPQPLVRPSLMAKRAVQIVCLLAIGAGMVEATFVYLPSYAVDAFGVNRSQASYLLIPLVLAMAVASPVAGRRLDRVGAAKVLGPGSLFLGIGLLVMAFAGNLMIHVLGTILLGLGLAGVLGSSVSYVLLREAGADERAIAQGLSTIAMTIGQMTGAALVGAVAASGTVGGYQSAFLVIAVIVVGMTVSVTGLKSVDR